MDRPIEKERRPWWHWVLLVGVLIISVVVVRYYLLDASIRTVRLPTSQVTISEASWRRFEDFTSVRGTVQPLNSVFLDAVNGGVVEQVFVEEGSHVEEGQRLLQLSNTDLRLSVSANDTAITEQLNNLNNIANGLETAKLHTEREIINIEYQIVALERQLRRQSHLASEELISREEIEALEDELAYQKRLLDNTLARQVLENRIRNDRQQQIATQIDKLEEHLTLAQDSIESLQVRAPISGQLTSLSVEIGESKSRGERLGQIDVVAHYKVVAQVDEFYLTRVTEGQRARFTLGGERYNLRVDRVYPEVNSGLFMIDLVFDQVMPDNLRRGQSLQLDLVLGDPVETLTVPAGSFIQETGGNWVFVLDESEGYAYRREVAVGRRNNRMLEITQGLAEGERIITSSYGAISDAERVQLIQ
ncbi:MAG: efflux RND transporter periplasmic adaptor subunit [Pseudohongiellaceae bacterium]